ncbi:GNAT family N-acetyltransferase [Paractinoplanes atraurantiacus]|uniref:FR47-like protein n=1 Tax=Paractinoplanes atraurantiacus TaxID=1036182 RepID=A0A285IQG4_9ACTN|nr:GNAT family N-acetyltransferase [Actinoplanes atraurantiacus]SNY49937.1 FR47-like protein [Actinoplanes atraurantiacus]
MTLDVRIQQSVVANLSSRPAPVRTGPFVIGVDPSVDSPGINYATPLPGLEISRADVTALVAAFRSYARKPRLEYVVSTAPGLERLLLDAGFTVEERHEYLVCTPGTIEQLPAPGGYTLREPITDADRAAMIAAQNAAFGGDPISTDADIARIAALQARGGIAVMALAPDGTCAGGGQAVPPNDGVSEVAGIAVTKHHRRRGIAGAMTAEITRRLFVAGAEIAWLEASGEDSWRVYERVGYRPTGRRLYIALD